MKYKDGRKRCRRIGEPRKSQSIYDNLGQEVNDLKDNITAICNENKEKLKEQAKNIFQELDNYIIFYPINEDRIKRYKILKQRVIGIK